RTISVLIRMYTSDSRPKEMLNEIYDLFMDLDAREEQLEFPVLYTNAKAGTTSLSVDKPGADLQPLFEAILETIPLPAGDSAAALQVLVAHLDYSDYLGRMAMPRVVHGSITPGES